MSNASSSSPNNSRQWLIGLTLLAVLILLLWWFWPSQPQSQQMGRGRFGDMGPVPVRVAEVQQGEFVIELRSEEHTSELQSRENLVCRLLLEKKKKKHKNG